MAKYLKGKHQGSSMMVAVYANLGASLVASDANTRAASVSISRNSTSINARSSSSSRLNTCKPMNKTQIVVYHCCYWQQNLPCICAVNVEESLKVEMDPDNSQSRVSQVVKVKADGYKRRLRRKVKCIMNVTVHFSYTYIP